MASEYYNEMKDLDTEKARAIMKNLPDYVSMYIKRIQFKTKPKTRLEYLKDIQTFFEYIADSNQLPSIQDVSLDVLNGLDSTFFLDYFEYLCAYEKDGKKRTNANVSIKRKQSALNSFFSYLYQNELIDNIAISKLDAPKLDKKEVIRLEHNEAKKLIKTVERGTTRSKKQQEYHNKQKTRDLAIITLLLSTGMRVSELVGLDLVDVDLENSSLRITRKGGKEESVKFSDEASAYLVEYIEERFCVSHVDTNALFLSSRKQRISIRSVEEIVKKYSLKAVPLKKISPHKLRATFATELYNATGDIYLVADILGHEDINTTKTHYASLNSDKKDLARNIIKYTD